MDPISAFLAEQGIDPMALVESLAFVIVLVLLYGAAISFGRAE